LNLAPRLPQKAMAVVLAQRGNARERLAEDHRTMASKYQIALIGRFAERREKLEELLFARTDELGIDRSQIAVLEETDIGTANPKAPLVAVFFGYRGADDADHSCIASLLKDSITIIPCVDTTAEASSQLPKSLSYINAFPMDQGNASFERLSTLILENLRLLRSERRLFISYKRSESQSIAIELYECLDKAGFDVFLDTRSVPYGNDFQSILWHRMADSDIVVLLDTPNFRASHWTQKELSRANATNIQILHLLWPTVKPDESSAFSEFVSLQPTDFKSSETTGEHARLTDAMTKIIVTKAESLRARAMAARHRSLVDNFCDRARDEKAKSVAVQPERFISVELQNGGKVAVVPTIGVPRADRYQEIEHAIPTGRWFN
jgi:TIR domain